MIMNRLNNSRSSFYKYFGGEDGGGGAVCQFVSNYTTVPMASTRNLQNRYLSFQIRFRFCSLIQESLQLKVWAR